MRDEKKIEKNIQETAYKLIFTRGIKGWNMNDFAKEAGITKRTLYHYIDSKESLVESTFIRFIKETQKTLEIELMSDEDYERKINKILKYYPQIVMRFDLEVIQNIFEQYPAIERTVINERENLTSILITFIKKGQSDNFFKDNMDPNTIIEVLQSLVIYHSKYNPTYFEHKLRESFTLVLYGFIQNNEVSDEKKL